MSDTSELRASLDASRRALVQQAAARDEFARAARRTALAALVAALKDTGDLLHISGSMVGPDRLSGASRHGNGTDALVAMARICQTARSLVLGAEQLLSTENGYAAAALNRQLVEVEYLAWAFAEERAEAESWMRSTREERLRRWQPRHLRERSQGRFRGSDYIDHCEIGGHPSPEGCQVLLDADDVRRELLLYEALNHGYSAWRYLLVAVVIWTEGTGWEPTQLVADAPARDAASAEAAWRAVERLPVAFGAA